jgi:hypothetical protein
MALGAHLAKNQSTRFDIAPLKGYYEKDGSTWIDPDRRRADTFTSLLGTSTTTDILTTATPGSGDSLSWWKGIFRHSEEYRIVETQANRRSVQHC